MGEGVDLERPSNRVHWFVKDGHGISHSCIVDQDRWVAVGLADLSADRGEVVGRCDIGLIEVDASFNCVRILELNWTFE